MAEEDYRNTPKEERERGKGKGGNERVMLTRLE